MERMHNVLDTEDEGYHLGNFILLLSLVNAFRDEIKVHVKKTVLQ